MSKIADYGEDFLKNGGRKLGYDENNMPKAKDIEVVMVLQIPVWEYKGMTEMEYYN